MAGIDRSDSIRRPVDSTLSTRTAHRGGEDLLQPQREAMAQLRQSAPAIAVVIEQHQLGTPSKPSFELLLSMNDQWIRVQSTKPFQPGTVLLIEATADDQIRVLPNPEPAQLNRMMQASLQFWQAHTLPKVHATSLPPLPATTALQQLISEQPELKPLIDWLNQKPALNARTLANWVREFMPLAPPQAQAGSASTQQTLINALPLQPSNQPNSSQTTVNQAPNTNAAGGDKATLIADKGAPGTVVQSAPSSPSTIAPSPMRALTEAIAASLPLLQQQPLRWLPLQQQPTGQWQPIHQPGTTQPLTLVASKETIIQIAATVTPAALVATKIPTAQPAAQVPAQAAAPATPRVTSHAAVNIPTDIQSLLRIQPVDAVALQQPQRPPSLLNQSLSPPVSSALSVLQNIPAGALRITVTPIFPTSSANATATATVLTPNLPAAGGNPNASSVSFSVSVTTTTVTTATEVATSPAVSSSTTNANPAPDWRPLPSRPGTTDQPPLEIRLAQWLLMIDNRIRQHPASLQQSLAQRAQQLLRSNDLNYGLDKPLPPLPQVHNSTAGDSANQKSATELQPLVQLRNWLEAVQGKTQNNAIQQTLGALAQGGDSPNQPVQQLSIPLIWMGPSSWANLEWWQEKASDAEEETGAGGKRLWRFRLFFELEPLAPLCADLVWEPQQTDLTFWSEDRNTLAFLNSHLGTLEQWTEGLGERQLHTRHGMPRKKSTPEADDFKPLVDIHT